MGWKWKKVTNLSGGENPNNVALIWQISKIKGIKMGFRTRKLINVFYK